VKASVIQGSGLGPASYIVTAADLHPVTPRNCSFKFADDTYLAVPAVNLSSRMNEIAHIEAWSRKNYLKLNRAKSKEMIIRAREKCNLLAQLPPPCTDIGRVTTMKALGVIINDRLRATDHVNSLLSSCSSLLFALRVLRSRGFPTASLQDVFRSTVL